MTSAFDDPRPAPASVQAGWRQAGLWTDSTVSHVIAGDCDLTATACVVDDERYTLGELRDWSVAVAMALRDHGVTAGDRVLVQLANSAELLASIMACWRLGVIAVPVLPMFLAHELTAVLRQIRPSAVIAGNDKRALTAEMDTALDAADVRPVRFSVGRAADGWAGFPGRAATSSDGDVSTLPGFAEPGACVLVLFTSGTTAEPKGVRHDSYSLLAEVNSYRRSAALSRRDVIFNPAPVAHVGALVVSLLVPWAIGCPVVLQSRWDPRRAVQMIAREKVTFAVGAPVFLNELVQEYESADAGGHRVTKFQTGAASTSTTLLRRAATVGIVAWRAWGMTEAPTLTYGTVGDDLDRRAGTDGRVEPGSDVRAVDELGRPLPDGTEGELLVRSPKQMMGYVAATPSASRSDERSDGWVATGDLGVVDAERWVTITGRLKDIINRGGEKFSCHEIEDALSAHPAINAVAVLGVPEQRLGEQVVAYLTTRSGAHYPGYDALVEHLTNSRLAPQKHPVAIVVLDELPMTPTGKVLKAALARRWQADSDEHPT
jgi:acyl-CoA synthetase (AMP-forming)/AMP-acid ligase II